MKAKLLLSSAPLALAFAASTLVPTGAMAEGRAVGQDAELLAIVICSNNGGGNDAEILAVGAPPGVCLKFQEVAGDPKPADPGNDVDLDPNEGIPN
jgi:hypothetical protein